jgi:hypothetical protein
MLIKSSFPLCDLRKDGKSALMIACETSKNNGIVVDLIKGGAEIN